MDFLQHNPLYVVGIISAMIWIGIFGFMYGVERRVRKLEKNS